MMFKRDLEKQGLVKLILLTQQLKVDWLVNEEGNNYISVWVTYRGEDRDWMGTTYHDYKLRLVSDLNDENESIVSLNISDGRLETVIDSESCSFEVKELLEKLATSVIDNLKRRRSGLKDEFFTLLAKQ